MSYAAWLDEQFAKPQSLHRLYINQAAADLTSVGQQLSNTNFWDSWWSQALRGRPAPPAHRPSPCREIMVISFADATLRNQTRGVASYYDMLGEKAFGNFRDMLEEVTFHPMMGIYLSHRGNMKEDTATGRVPDLNFAREITQLFAVGQDKLNADGTEIMGADGRPAVGLHLRGPRGPVAGVHRPQLVRRPAAHRPHRRPLPRQERPTSSATGGRCRRTTSTPPNTSYHSISDKDFLGTTIPAMAKPTTDADVKIALDTLFNHPNVGPFIGKQLIQRLVTSNPSPAYVDRVAAAFNNNGQGVRGDMKAVCKAILLDPEARTVSTSPSAGKVREPVLRLSQMLRAFNATSVSGRYTGIGLTDNPSNEPGPDADVRADGVQLLPSGLRADEQGDHRRRSLVVPELQIAHRRVGGGLHELHPHLDVAQRRPRHPAQLRRRDGARRARRRRWSTG